MPDPADQQGSLRHEITLPRVVAAVSGVAALISAGKTIAAETTGADLIAGQFLFYVAAATFGLYIAVAAGMVVAAGCFALCELVNISEDDAAWVVIPLGLAAVIVMVVTLLDGGVLFDWEGTDDFGRVSFALLGAALLAVPAWLVASKKT